MKHNWIIGICDSEGEGVTFKGVLGTRDEAVSYLRQLMKEDQEIHDEDEFEDSYDYDLGKDSWYGVNLYYDSHVDFTLIREWRITYKEF